MRNPIFSHQNYRSVLESVFEEKRKRNPSYSLRAFARDIKVAPSTLSGLLNRQHGLSPARAKRIAEALQMTTEERNYFCSLVEAEETKSEKRKKKAEQDIESAKALWLGGTKKITLHLSVPKGQQNLVAEKMSAFKTELESLAALPPLAQPLAPQAVPDLCAMEFVCHMQAFSIPR